MKIQHIRNACMVIHSKEYRILVDPCLNPKGSLPPYTLFRRRPKLNPLVDLPENSESMLCNITAGLITHCRFGHFDHLDRSGIKLLKKNSISVYCSRSDESFLKGRKIKTIPLHINKKSKFLDGSITPIPAKHGRGIIGKLMGKGVGYFIELPSEKTLYISGDTILTSPVKSVLSDLKPNVAVLNAGTATLDIGKPILMTIDEQLEFIKMAPGKVIAVHMDAFNHCLTSRDRLREALLKNGLSEKVIIPDDGELVEI